MLAVFKNFWRNIIGCYKGYNLLWQTIAVLLTFVIVISRFDVKYFQILNQYNLRPYIFPAMMLGTFLPLLLPLLIYLQGKISKDFKTIATSLAVGQAAIIGILMSSFYKIFTGRIPPTHWNMNIDAINSFQFGFMRGGIFWGWPSSHTTIAFAMAFSLFTLYPKNKILRILCVLYALYVGFSVSIFIHWFSEFIAGAIFGTIVGATIGKKSKALS